MKQIKYLKMGQDAVGLSGQVMRLTPAGATEGAPGTAATNPYAAGPGAPEAGRTSSAVNPYALGADGRPAAVQVRVAAAAAG